MQAPSSPPRVSTSSNDTPNCQKNAPRAHKYAYPPPVPPHPPPSLGNYSPFPHLHSPLPPLPRRHPTATGNCQKNSPGHAESRTRPPPRINTLPLRNAGTGHRPRAVFLSSIPLVVPSSPKHPKKNGHGCAESRTRHPLGSTHLPLQYTGTGHRPRAVFLSSIPLVVPSPPKPPKKTATGAQNGVPGTLSVQLTSHFNIQARGIAPMPSSFHLAHIYMYTLYIII